MIAFLIGVYIGGAIVDATTGLFIGENTKEAAIGAAIWPYNTAKLLVKFFRRR